MFIVHGTWIPSEADDFVRDGGFFLWVETDAPIRHPKCIGETGLHPRHLSHATLEEFLDQRLQIRAADGATLDPQFVLKSFLLPTADGVPLPSFELAPYVDVEMPERWDFAPWQVSCYPLRYPLASLNDIQYIALHAAEDFQLGTDIVFWTQFSQVLKRVVAGDNYIPRLVYREMPSKRNRKQPQFELYSGWELVSPAYEFAVEQYAACMPAVCVAGTAAPTDTALYTPESLLRHFSENTLVSAVAGTSMTAAQERQFSGSLLDDCLHPSRPIVGTEADLETYRQWIAWRTTLRASQTDAGFTLCFRLVEAPPNDTDAWRVEFLIGSKADPSLRLSLEEYWKLGSGERAALGPRFGADVERHLLLALGHAARTYPAVWAGLDTDQPTGFSLTLAEAESFLAEAAWILQDAGYIVMVPSWWTPEGRRRAQIRLRTTPSAASSSNARGYFSLDTLIEFEYQLSIGGETVSEAEWRQLLDAKTSLVLFRGQWMELDRDRMQQMIEYWRNRRETQPEMTLLDLMKTAADSNGDLTWDHTPALEEILGLLGDKSRLQPAGDPENFQGALRAYQQRGLAWLRYLEGLGLNPCLADDMGLGKTVQVIAQLVAERNDNPAVGPTLLVAPTSVLGNWQREIERFAPGLRALIHQGPERPRTDAAFLAAADEADVVVVSFALARLDEKLLRSVRWHRVVVDEAQNIKNPAAAQTKAIAKLPASHRLALTGTPVENRLRDLWSIFNFLNPGYLGKEAQFRKSFEVPIERNNDVDSAETLKKLVEPFILRRVKTDPQIISDLPEKIEQKLYCNLTPEQASLYELVVKEAMGELDGAEGMERRGLILATLTKLKQICNHPAHYLHDGSAFTAERSHKLERLTEMAQEALENGESALIFTQFTEIGDALERYLRRTLHCTTYYLHGGVPARKRDAMVMAFQDPESEPAVFILSVRAGGIGLNLTRANHVFHYDRWWNPAVEDQATDRAFRIGQHRNVFVRKFVGIGTVEERIDEMIEDKKRLAGSIVGSDESWLTELDNETFKDLIVLRQGAIV